MSTAVTCDAEKERIQSLHRHVEAKHYHVTFEPLFRAIPAIDFQGLTGFKPTLVNYFYPSPSCCDRMVK